MLMIKSAHQEEKPSVQTQKTCKIFIECNYCGPEKGVKTFFNTPTRSEQLQLVYDM